MNILEAIYHRRAVREYTDLPVPRALIEDLIQAAIQAPSAVNQQPWAFVVIRGRHRLEQWGARAKAQLLAVLPPLFSLHQRADALASDDYDVFHHAGTVVVICSFPARHHPDWDCCLAAQNFMLAAHGFGLGTCPVAFARPWFNLPEVKAELGIPPDCNAIMPIVVGWPAAIPPAPARRAPDIVCWIEDKPAAQPG